MNSEAKQGKFPQIQQATKTNRGEILVMDYK